MGMSMVISWIALLKSYLSFWNRKWTIENLKMREEAH